MWSNFDRSNLCVHVIDFFYNFLEYLDVIQIIGANNYENTYSSLIKTYIVLELSV